MAQYITHAKIAKTDTTALESHQTDLTLAFSVGDACHTSLARVRHIENQLRKKKISPSEARAFLSLALADLHIAEKYFLLRLLQRRDVRESK